MGGVEMMAHRCKCGGKWRYFLFCRPNSIYCATPLQLNRELKIVLKHNYTRRWRALLLLVSAPLITNSSIWRPVLRAKANQRGSLPRPDQVSDGSLGF